MYWIGKHGREGFVHGELKDRFWSPPPSMSSRYSTCIINVIFSSDYVNSIIRNVVLLISCLSDTAHVCGGLTDSILTRLNYEIGHTVHKTNTTA